MPLLTIDTARLAESGCKIAESDQRVMIGLLGATQNDPCTDCSFLDGGRCKAYQLHHSKAPQNRQRERESSSPYVDKSGLVGGRWKGMPIRRIAEIEGISLNEARRRKDAGHYRE